MCYLRAERIIDYLCDPGRELICTFVRQPHPVAKLYDVKPKLVVDNSPLERLHEMISNSNPVVSFVFFTKLGLR